MILRTTVNVTHIDPSKPASGATKSGIVIMNVGGRVFIEQPDGRQRIEALYEYRDADGNILPTSNNNRLELEGDIDAISASLGNSGASFSEHFRADVRAYAMNEMASLFGITTSDIEEVV